MNTLDIESDAKPLTDAEFERIDALAQEIKTACERAIGLAKNIIPFISGEVPRSDESEFLKEFNLADRRIYALRRYSTLIVRRWKLITESKPLENPANEK